MHLARRLTLAVLSALLFAGAAFTASSASAQDVEVAALMKPGPLGDRGIGNPSAPITIVEYASLTCPYCAEFHRSAFPHLRSQYIDQGLVYFVLRDYPLDNNALAAAILARCAPEDAYYPFIEMLFASDEWLRSENPFEALRDLVKRAGIAINADACLANTGLGDAILATARQGEAFGVNSTPTFFVNGQRYVGALTVEALDGILRPLL